MKALVFEEYAQDDSFEEILEVREIPEPVPGYGEVVFEVHAAALNHDDIWAMRGKPIEVPMPHVSGTDAAGIVKSIGDGVREIKVGDRIVSHANLSCRVCSLCTSGREFDCRHRKVWGFQTGPMWGGFCELAHLPESNVVRIPENVGTDEAAAASMTMMTSWHMLAGRAKVRPGQTVLVMGGGSGMGTFGIQIAKLFGCTVIATASASKLKRCMDLGADYAVDHRRDDWDEEVRGICGDISAVGGSGAIDIAYEHIGGEHWKRVIQLMARGGTIVSTGATTGYMVDTDLHRVYSENLSILGSTQGTRAELEECLYWMSKGRLGAVIDSKYPMSDAAAAHKKMLRGGIFGKVLMDPRRC